MNISVLTCHTHTHPEYRKCKRMWPSHAFCLLLCRGTRWRLYNL